MKFEENQTIFFQIAERFRWDILNGKRGENERLPSIRETAVELQVNPNTVAKAYTELEDGQIIHKQRGLGYYVSPGAKERIAGMKKEVFFKRELPKVFKALKMLDISPEELRELYNKFMSEEK